MKEKESACLGRLSMFPAAEGPPPPWRAPSIHQVLSFKTLAATHTMWEN